MLGVIIMKYFKILIFIIISIPITIYIGYCGIYYFKDSAFSRSFSETKKQWTGIRLLNYLVHQIWKSNAIIAQYMVLNMLIIARMCVAINYCILGATIGQQFGFPVAWTHGLYVLARMGG